MNAAGSALLRVRGLCVRYPSRRGVFAGPPSPPAVDDVTFEIARGTTLGLVGESGSGKSTTARALLRLVAAESGEVTFGDLDVLHLTHRELRTLRRRAQIVFQDPYSSLDPRMTVGETIAEGMFVHRLVAPADVRDRTAALLQEVGLSPELAGRMPDELSGGQRQRVAIARALAVQPELLVLDEAVSALDVTTQDRILHLIEDVRDGRGLTCLFIAHNLAVVERIATTVAVMYMGRIVEAGPTRDVFAAPQHPYTRALLSAVPIPDPSIRRRWHAAGDRGQGTGHRAQGTGPDH